MNIQDFPYFLSGKTVFLTIDLVRVYNQILVSADNITKTAITTLFGLFGLCNAAQTFQHVIDGIHQGLDFSFYLQRQHPCGIRIRGTMVKVIL